MGPLAGDGCTCDQPGAISDDKWRQLEHRLLAKVEEALNQPGVLGTSYGVLLWGMLGNVLVIWLGKIFCMFREIDRFKEALRKISKYMINDLQTTSEDGGSAGAPDAAAMHTREDGGSAGAPDAAAIHECATVLAAQLGNANSEISTTTDIQQKEEEMRCREKMRRLASKPKGNRDDDKLPTHDCDTSSPSMSTSACQGVNPSVSAPSPDICIPLGMYMPDKTLKGKRQQQLCNNTRRILGIHTLAVQNGSIFLSATVSIQPSGMKDLLHRATELVNMGSRIDPACTVQLGAAALLYRTSGEKVETLLLEQGVYDVPIITSIQRFHTKTIMIKGFYLKDTEIKASISAEKSVRLNVLYYQELDKGVEVLFAQLPKDELLGEKTLIYANKSICIEGCANLLVLRSIAKEIDIHKHRSTILGTLCTRQIWISLSLLCVYQVMVVKPWRMPRMEWVFQLITLIFSLLLVEYIIGPWTFYIITRCLQYMMQSTNLDIILVLKEISKRKTQGVESSSKRNMVTATNTREFESRGEDDDTDSTDTDHSTDTTRGEDDDTNEGTVNDVNWEWPCYECFLRGGRLVKELAHAKASLNDVGKRPFEVVTTLNKDGSVKQVDLIVHSTRLIQVLKECEPKTGAHFKEGSAINPKEIFYRREALTAYVDKNSGKMIAGDNVQLSTSVWHVKHVLRFMEQQFAEVLEQYERMKAAGCVSYDMLWAFFMPEDEVCRRCLVTNQECFATVNRPASYVVLSPSEVFCIITLNVMDFNVRSYNKCTIHYQIDEFKGEVPFTSLKVCPLHFFPNRKEMQAHFILMGKIFYQVAMQQPFCFRQFKGSLNFYQREDGCMRLRKFNADGRVMIDLLSFARMNPDYHLGNAQPPCEVMVGMWTPHPGQMKKPHDEDLKMAPAFAYGFSFQLKKWGCFELCGLQQIVFNQGAFNALRMKDENLKTILRSVVQQYTGESGMQDYNQRLDPIANKGTGCIVLCHGPPGTGKTLTAEALAETLQRPLWSISAFELGDEPHKVEKTLGQILEIAHTWRAILLLDEADAYLERRGEGVDVKRNLLTGVFLRVLEYYRGIMFLTTNRVTAFDDAILSRTTLAISYPALDDMQRRAIWEKLLEGTSIDDATCKALLQHDLNGRQIRNIVHLAQVLARDRGGPLRITDVLSALDVSTVGTKDLPHNL